MTYCLCWYCHKEFNSVYDRIGHLENLHRTELNDIVGFCQEDYNSENIIKIIRGFPLFDKIEYLEKNKDTNEIILKKVYNGDFTAWREHLLKKVNNDKFNRVIWESFKQS